MGYAGGHRYLTYLSLLLSAVSAVLALFPFVFLSRIIREVIFVQAAINKGQKCGSLFRLPHFAML